MGQRSAHMHVRHAVKLDSLDAIPVQAAEKGYVLFLNMSVEFGASHAVCRADRKPDQFCAKLAHASVMLIDGQTRSPPDAWRRLMNADGSHDFGWLCRHCRNGRKRDGDLVDFIAVVQFEYALLINEHGVAKLRNTLKFPIFGCSTDYEFRADER
ncbi:hypothetical protein RU07_06050 [Agrobacterium tumefaciens]|uniref:Uncharacterized protein n=1 Tax=Agrobacterium tumefaciens TaxID=358 RepID=A0A0D0L3G6_AGRTU|nr:hypothetical protein RU07_06050 [Agrobacterium tumefaciens]